MLSPKKFIETKARNLPVYECYVNSDWEESKMANVIVMRKHANQKITGGIYLVDLLCLGVKDTIFVYNEEELSLKERVFEGQNNDLDFEKIDYMLAHNIIYAGHDFAMEFDIKPDARFATTKYILEEDTDDIELIDIEVGDENGNPMLVVQQAGQYADALLKLKKNAGEGNYTYVVGEDLEDEDLDEDEYDNLDDYKEGEINPFSACSIKTLDLLDKEKISQRSGPEKLSLEIEMFIRLLLDDREDYVYEEGPEYNWIEGALEYPSSIDKAGIEQYTEGIKTLQSIEDFGINVVNALDEIYKIISEKYPFNLLLASTFYLQEIMDPNEKLHRNTSAVLTSFAGENSFAILSLAIYALIKNEEIEQYRYIFEQEDIYKVFPKVANFSAIELLLFFLIKVVLFTRENNIEKALKYYQLVTAINISNWVLFPVQIEFLAFLDRGLDDTVGSKNN